MDDFSCVSRNHMYIMMKATSKQFKFDWIPVSKKSEDNITKASPLELCFQGVFGYRSTYHLPMLTELHMGLWVKYSALFCSPIRMM